MEAAASRPAGPAPYRAYGPRNLDRVAARYGLSDSVRATVERFSLVLPFRVNDYVLSELIDWSDVPADPLFQLVFPQPGMLSAPQERALAEVASRAPSDRLRLDTVRRIRAALNPHPGGQRELNVPLTEGERLPGVQHKYRETVLYFPAQGQSCHAYCTYCFRWAQFVDDTELRFAAPGPERLVSYLRQRPEVSDVLVTGGDPLMMAAEPLRRHLMPLLDVGTVRTVRIGTKAPAYWPARFVTDRDSDDVLRLFEAVTRTGRTLAVMAHFSHARELTTDLARRALERIRSTGAVVHCQAPLVAHVNDTVEAWTRLWRAESAAGAVPYYMFVARDTGPHRYFEVPLARAVELFRQAYQRLPGLARTVRGPVMSTSAGKIVLDGELALPHGRFFQCRLVQARDPGLVGRPFLLHHDDGAAWIDGLRPDKTTVPADIAAALHADTASPEDPGLRTAPAASGGPARPGRPAAAPLLGTAAQAHPVAVEPLEGR
ncbi:KamA family radical SAM protein [Streptomyces sp. NPDC090106]|uniref:KamA family radical SAM protein n=1 Tax=Streptomyces sp. NPDC090106 TaxID=3365946 RepID=UPI0038289187